MLISTCFSVWQISVETDEHRRPECAGQPLQGDHQSNTQTLTYQNTHTNIGLIRLLKHAHIYI